jgi:hypothetical protein
MDGVIEWLNENELRAYPFLEGAISTPFGENFILDLQLVLDNETSLDNIPAFLGVSITEQELLLNFTGNTFHIPRGEASSGSYWRNTNGSLVVLGPGAATMASIEEAGELVCNIPVEPATVYYFDGAWLGVNSVAPYRGYLTTVGSHEPLLPLVPDTESLQLAGDVELSAGYNYGIDFRGGKINLTAAFGLGLPMTCESVFISSDQKDCLDLVSYINGISPDKDGVFRFTPGNNIYIFNGLAVPDNIPDETTTPPISRVNENTVFVGLTFLETDLCSPVQLLPTNN